MTCPGVIQVRNSLLRQWGTRQRRVVPTTSCARGVAPIRFTFQKDTRQAREVVEDGCGQHTELIASQGQLLKARAAVEGGRRQRALLILFIPGVNHTREAVAHGRRQHDELILMQSRLFTGTHVVRRLHVQSQGNPRNFCSARRTSDCPTDNSESCCHLRKPLRCETVRMPLLHIVLGSDPISCSVCHKDSFRHKYSASWSRPGPPAALAEHARRLAGP